MPTITASTAELYMDEQYFRSLKYKFGFEKNLEPSNCYQTKRGVAIFAKAFMGIPAQQAAKITRPLMPSAAPAVLLHSLHTQQGVCNIVIAMTRRDFVKPAFSLRIKRFVKTHALSLLGTTRLLSRSG